MLDLRCSIAVLLILIVYSGNWANAETFIWNFHIDEQSVRNGPEADGSTNSPGFGEGVITLDSETGVISYDLAWEGLVGDLTKLHIHGPAGPSESNPQHIVEIFGPPELPTELVSTSGSVSNRFEVTTLFQTGFDPLTPEQIMEVMIEGEAYVNVHTTVFGMGEIRGNLGYPTPEPHSGTMLLFGVFAAFGFLGRKR